LHQHSFTSAASLQKQTGAPFRQHKNGPPQAPNFFLLDKMAAPQAIFFLIFGKLPIAFRFFIFSLEHLGTWKTPLIFFLFSLENGKRL
jgi:hypothetical protein